MSKEAMKLAMEALEESLGYVQEEAENAQRLYGQYPTRQARIQGLKDDARKHMDAITALRVALASEAIEQPAQPQQAPVLFNGLTEAETNATASVMGLTKKAQQEPVAFDVVCEACGGNGLDQEDQNYRCTVCNGLGYSEKYLYTSPPAHSKPLSDAEIWRWNGIMSVNADIGWHMEDIVRVARAIEAAHGIKENT